MYGVVATFKMDAEREAEQKTGLHEQVIPMVRQSPGFLSGYWTRDQASSKSHSLTLFDSEGQASAFAESVKGNKQQQDEAGVHLESIAVVSVEGEAHR